MRISSFPSHFFSAQPINHCEIWLFLCSPMAFISIMHSLPTCLLIFLPHYISWQIHRVLVPVTWSLFVPHAVIWQHLFCRVGTEKRRCTSPGTSCCGAMTKTPALSAAIWWAAGVPCTGNARLSHHFACCCVTALTVCTNYWIHSHSTNAFAVIHSDLWKLTPHKALCTVLIPKSSSSLQTCGSNCLRKWPKLFLQISGEITKS